MFPQCAFLLLAIRIFYRLPASYDLIAGKRAAADKFSDQSRLAALFKRYHHSSPVAYRKLNNKEVIAKVSFEMIFRNFREDFGVFCELKRSSAT